MRMLIITNNGCAQNGGLELKVTKWAMLQSNILKQITQIIRINILSRTMIIKHGTKIHMNELGMPMAPSELRIQSRPSRSNSEMTNMLMKHEITGWWLSPTPLKIMSSSVGMMKFPIYGKIQNVPNHQPVNTGHEKKTLVCVNWSRIFPGHLHRTVP